MIQKEFLAKFSISTVFQETIGGRAVSVLLSSPMGPPDYVVTVHAERFDANMTHLISEERKRLHDITSNATPRPGYGIIHGDFNFVGAHRIRWEGRANGIWVVPRKPSDIWGENDSTV